MTDEILNTPDKKTTFSEADQLMLEGIWDQMAGGQLSVPWQFPLQTSGAARDADGFEIKGSGLTVDSVGNLTRKELRAKIWDKFHSNPHVNTSTRDMVGRIVGEGYQTISEIPEISEVIDETEYDYRNRLYDYWPKYLTQAIIGGELPLCLTCHKNGFIEVDFVDPDLIDEGQADQGIIFHPNKTRMPLIYCLKDSKKNYDEHVPSVYLARYPNLLSEVAQYQKGFENAKLKESRKYYRNKEFKKIGGFNRFIVMWDLGLMTSRSRSHMQTILIWLNYWETLKKYEIDHKKSSGAYVYIVKFENVKSWLKWLSLTDAQRAATGIAAAKSPGGTLVLGPDMSIEVKNPTLPKISEGDTDIMQMISSGLNSPMDMLTGMANGPYASVKASRAPMSDRGANERTYFERWLVNDFWGNIFYLKSAISGFPSKFKVKEATKWKGKNPVFETVSKRPEQCMEVLFPTSAIDEIESITKALLGVKHGSLKDVAGIPYEMILKRLGFRGYGRLRLMEATEKNKYPETMPSVDQESLLKDKNTGKAKQNNDSNSDEDSSPDSSD